VNVFSPELPEDIHVEKDGDSVKVRFGEADTIGYNFTEDGVSITPDWTDRRFTLALLANSAFFHVTEEGEDEWKREEARHMSHEGLIAEFYDSIRNVGDVGSGNFRPITMYDFKKLYHWDIEEVKDFLRKEALLTIVTMI